MVIEALNQTGQQTLTVSTNAVSLTLPASPNGRPKRALIYIGGQPIRWRADGTAPTATAGMPVGAGAYIEWVEGKDFYGLIKNVQFIRDTSATADATLEIAYFS